MGSRDGYLGAAFYMKERKEHTMGISKIRGGGSERQYPIGKFTWLCLICAQNSQQYMGFYGNIW